ncbi:MAG: ABC transporter permease [Deltaproteobacteria bacterium]|nr:ABC transporter permease [Deltaproteobacteria bacterium]
MFYEIRLAWRNLWRHRTRTIISGMAVSLSFASLLISFGVADANYVQLLRVAIKTAGGSVLIHADGWQQSHANDLLITSADQVTAAAETIKGVSSIIPRIIVQGLLTSSRGAEPVQLFGIDSPAQAKLLDLSPYIMKGNFLEKEDKRALVIGEKLAKKLGVSLGDRIVMMASDITGEPARALFRVSGILEPRAGIDTGVAFTSINAAAAAIGAKKAITEIGLVLDDDTQRAKVIKQLQGLLNTQTQSLEFLPWEKALPDLLGAIQADKAFGWLYGLLVFLIMGFGIANTFLMSVLERVRELGLLSALGLTPIRTIRLILYEATVLTAVSVVIGYALALAMHGYLSSIGIDVAAISNMQIELAGVTIEDMHIRSVIDPMRWGLGGIGVVLIVLLSACYPAMRAAKLDPIIAMRTYE